MFWRLLVLYVATCVLAAPRLGRRPRRRGRRTAAETLDPTDARYDTGMLVDEAQVAVQNAAFLSIVRDEVTPAMLVEVLHLSLRSAPGIYGAAIAFEPDSFPWRKDALNQTGSVDPASPSLAFGVRSASGSSFWLNMSDPWKLPNTTLWEGREAVLYAPYVARGPTDPHKLDPPYEIVMDLADSYNYFDPTQEWYHHARTMFLQGELPFLTGYWGQPYNDEGAGGIEMVTYSVPFTRFEPVPSMGPPPNVTAPYGWPENSPVRMPDGGTRYFWGIATVDIDLSLLDFSCAAGQEYSAELRDCIDCEGWLAYSNADGRCEDCREFEVPTATKTACTLNFYYAGCSVIFHIMVFLLVVPAMIRLRRPLYILQARRTEQGLILYLCNKHFLSKSSLFHSKVLDMPSVTVHRSGCPALDLPGAPLRFRVVGESQIEVFRSDGADLDVVASQIFKGYARIGLRYELFHITMVLRVPLVAWLLAQFLAGVSVGIVWAYNGASLVTRMFNTGVGSAIYTAIASGIRLTWRLNARRRQQARAAELKEAELKRILEEACWEAPPFKEKHSFVMTPAQEEARAALTAVGWKDPQLNELTKNIIRNQSYEAGVSVAYMLSEEWESLARDRSGQENPTFYDLKDVMFFGDFAIGKDFPCPRDHRLGCALVDTLPRPYRRACTHFLSWTWKYTIGQVRSALDNWIDESNLDPAKTFLYMCFFVNNQYRILIECDGAGSTNLEEVFETTLKRVGRVVAVLDRWESPTYLTRIWTIFEQFTAVKLNVPVTMILPKDQNEALIEKVQEGRDGIMQVTKSLCRFKSQNAHAFSPHDEAKVKQLIVQDLGFEMVDIRVKEFMLNWVGNVVHDYMKNLMDLDVAMTRISTAATSQGNASAASDEDDTGLAFY